MKYIFCDFDVRIINFLIASSLYRLTKVRRRDKIQIFTAVSFNLLPYLIMTHEDALRTHKLSIEWLQYRLIQCHVRFG